MFSISEEEEEEGSQDSDEGQDLRAPPPRDVTSSSSVTGPSPSSIVKLEANQKARNKKQRQELYGKADGGFIRNLHEKHLFCVSSHGLLTVSVSIIELHRLTQSLWCRRRGQSTKEEPQ